MEPQTQSAFTEEKLQLTKTAVVMDEQFKQLDNTPRYTGSDFTEQVLEDARETTRKDLSSSSQQPYFARLDFEEVGTSSPSKLYIGKKGVNFNETNRPLVIDWRAPVASLFYSFTGGDTLASYECPEGDIEGKVHLKRNIVIRERELERVVDTYSEDSADASATDEFLIYRLGENKDNRLRDIVSTIQAEQDKIIRATKNISIIIQGVAGSGKTTVALHRLAYLLYQYREQVHAERMIIFAPNRMFLDYISGVLPELGVGDIQQTTFADWALDVLEHQVNLMDASEELDHWFAIKDTQQSHVDEIPPGRFKGSIAFMNYLETCLLQHAKDVVPSKPYEPWGGNALSPETVQEWFYQEYAHYPLVKRTERIHSRIERWIMMELDKVRDPSKRKEYKKLATQRLRTYMKLWPQYSPFGFYSEIMAPTENSRIVPQECRDFVPSHIKERTAKDIKKKKVREEDLPALVYIRHILYGNEGRSRFDHVVIDEAQDFSPFQVALLKRFTRENSFTILGDLSQGIHAYKGIHLWNEFIDLFESAESAYFQLDRSYRSTTEIINFANEVLINGGGDPLLAVPVFRSGQDVTVRQIATSKRIDEISTTVRHFQQTAAKTIAIVGRTAKECQLLHNALHNVGIEASLIDAKQSAYGGGISVVPVYLTKGLEFDAVVIVDADEHNYSSHPHDAKLLYVACTRALHELHLLYTGVKSPLI